MQYKSVQQALVPGRAVLYFNPINGLTELAVVLGDAEEVGIKGGGQGLGQGGGMRRLPKACLACCPVA